MSPLRVETQPAGGELRYRGDLPAGKALAITYQDPSARFYVIISCNDEDSGASIYHTGDRNSFETPNDVLNILNEETCVLEATIDKDSEYERVVNVGGSLAKIVLKHYQSD